MPPSHFFVLDAPAAPDRGWEFVAPARAPGDSPREPEAARADQWERDRERRIIRPKGDA